MGIIVKHADGSEFLNIANKTYDESSTSLKLPGKGVLHWGEAYVNNFVHLLENFASSIEPKNPQVGQMWYNTGNGMLSVYTTSQEWEVVNKDSDIEEKFDELIETLKTSNSGTIPPEDAVAGQTWFDTNVNVLKVFDGTKWDSFGFNTTSSYMQPENPEASDMWFDKNINNLKVHDGSRYQRILSTVESSSQPSNVSTGQFWTNTSTGQIFVYKQEPSTTEYYWQELGADDVTEGEVLPESARTGSLHITRTSTDNILYVNKGSKSDPVWTEIPEHGGAINSVNEPTRVVDGMFWLDGNNTLKIRKSGEWVDIDETAISYVSETMPESAKDGLIWFDTEAGKLKIKVDNSWEEVQDTGIIKYGVAPSTPKTGHLWYDTNDSELKIFNGSRWTTVNSSSTIVGYQKPVDARDGQLWLDTTSSELKIKKSGRWASLPENARAYLDFPANPKNGDMVYSNGKLKVYDGSDWKDININIDNSTTGDSVSVNYDEVSHEIVISSNGTTERVPLAVKRDVIVENVGVTSDIVEVIKPDIKKGERRIIDIEKVNMDRQFFVFKNGQFTDDYKVDGKDLVLTYANGDDEIDILQFNGDISINYVVKKFESTVNGNFTIDNYTRTAEEQKEYNVIKKEYDAKKEELINEKGENSSEDDLTDADWDILEEIENRFPVKESNNIADLSLGSILVFKEGVFIPLENLTVNENNQNKLTIPNTEKGEQFTIVQLIAGNDYKTSFYSREYSFEIGAEKDNTEDQYNVAGRVLSEMTQTASANPDSFGKVDVDYTFNGDTKTVEFDLVDINPEHFFFVTRNNLFVSPTNYTVDKDNNTISIHANNKDKIRFFQLYLPHNYVPVEFNYKQTLAKSDGWVTLDLDRNFNLDERLLVYRNGILQDNETVNLITEEEVEDEDGNEYTVSGLRKIQIFGDMKTNKISTPGIQEGDIVTVMQVSQAEIYDISFEEFNAMNDGFNIFTFTDIDPEIEFMVYRNGIKLNSSEFELNDENRLIVSDCNGPTEEKLSEDSNAVGDSISVFQFFTKDMLNQSDLTSTKDSLTATETGSENFYLDDADYLKDEFLLVFKNGQLISRRQEEDENTTQTQINTYKLFIDRVYDDKEPIYDSEGNQMVDSNGDTMFRVSEDNYTDKTTFNIDNVDSGEKVEVISYNKKVTNVNNLTSNSHFEILPKNNIQRIYTNKFSQLSNMTMVFQDGLVIDRITDSNGNDTVRQNGMLRLIDQYAVDNNNKSVIVNDWKVGGKLRIQQFTAKETDIKSVTLSVKIASDGTYDVFLPNDETYIPNAGSIEVYVDRLIQWSGEDFQEVANNRIMFTKALNKSQEVRMKIRK